MLREYKAHIYLYVEEHHRRKIDVDHHESTRPEAGNTRPKADPRNFREAQQGIWGTLGNSFKAALNEAKFHEAKQNEGPHLKTEKAAIEVHQQQSRVVQECRAQPLKINDRGRKRVFDLPPRKNRGPVSCIYRHK